MGKATLPKRIGSTAVRPEGEPFTIDSGKLKGEKFISLVPVDKNDYSRWEYRFATGQALHMFDRNGDLIP